MTEQEKVEGHNAALLKMVRDGHKRQESFARSAGWMMATLTLYEKFTELAATDGVDVEIIRAEARNVRKLALDLINSSDQGSAPEKTWNKNHRA